MKNDNQKSQSGKPGIGSAYSQQPAQPGQVQQEPDSQKQAQPGDGAQSSAARQSDDGGDARKRDAGRNDSSGGEKPALNMAGRDENDDQPDREDADESESRGNRQA